MMASRGLAPPPPTTPPPPPESSPVKALTEGWETAVAAEGAEWGMGLLLELGGGGAAAAAEAPLLVVLMGMEWGA